MLLSNICFVIVIEPIKEITEESDLIAPVRNNQESSLGSRCKIHMDFENLQGSIDNILEDTREMVKGLLKIQRSIF